MHYTSVHTQHFTLLGKGSASCHYNSLKSVAQSCCGGREGTAVQYKYVRKVSTLGLKKRLGAKLTLVPRGGKRFRLQSTICFCFES